MLTLLRRLAFLAPALLLLGCEKEPDFSEVPSISPNKVEVFRSIETGNVLDSISVTINWTDGDGDLGYLPNQRDTSSNSVDFNYYLRLFKRKNGAFVEVLPSFRATDFNGGFNNLSPDGPTSTKKRKLRGTLSYAVNGPGFILDEPIGRINGVPEIGRAGDVLRFEIYIVDRAGNKSNVITTQEVKL